MDSQATTSAAGADRAAVWFWLGCAAVMLASAALRFTNLSFDLPYVYHPDEPYNLAVVHDMIRQGTAHPSSYVYPTFFYYMHVPGQLLVKAIDGELQPFAIQTMGNTYTPQPLTFLVARALTACIGVAAVIGAMLLAREIGLSRWTALLAGALVAVNPLLVFHSQMMTPDVPSALFCTLALIGAVRALRTSSLGSYLFGGVMTGLAAASKYNAGLVGISLAASYVFSIRAATRLPLLEWAALVSLLTFLLACPYMILDGYNAWRNVLYTLHVYQVGHLGAEGGALPFNLFWIWNVFGASALLALLVVGHRARWRMLPVAVFFVVYFVMLSVQVVRFERNLAPILPALAVLIGAGAEAALLFGRRWLGRGLPVLAAIAAVLIVAPGARGLATDWSIKYGNHVRESARVWIGQHVAPGASIIADSYAPYSDPAVYRVTDTRLLLRNPPEQLASYDVVIVTAGGSGRLLRAGEAAAIATLDQLRQRACETHEFRNPQGIPEIWVFKLRC